MIFDRIGRGSLGGACGPSAGACVGLIALLSLSTAPVHALGPAPDARPNRIVIEYVPPKNPDHQKLYEYVKEHRVLEKFQEVFSPVLLQIDLPIKMTDCGMSNAWYGHPPAMTICYEYLADIRNTTPKETTPEGITPMDAVVGQLVYVVFHEMGHAMFDQLSVPLFGRPEDAADGFATYMMLRLGQNDARKVIGGAIYTYQPYFNSTKVTAPVTAFADVHGAPMQRMYNLMCWAYGADKKTFGDVVEKKYLPESRAQSCGMEWGELKFAFQQLIRPYLDPQLAQKVLSTSWLPDTDVVPPRAQEMPPVAK